MSLIKLHPALKYYTLSKNFSTFRCKSLAPAYINTGFYTKTLLLKTLNFNSKIRQVSTRQLKRKFIETTKSVKNLKPFNHSLFSTYKSIFKGKELPLIGGIPSYYLSDIKPVKNWKFANVFLKSGETDSTYVRLKTRLIKNRPADFKRTICKRIRLRFMRLLLSKDLKTPTMSQHLLNFKPLTDRLLKFKPTLKRVTPPVYVAKWKTSYPLMFTNNIYLNKTLKPQLDLTIKTFIQSRTNKRVRRYKKILFRKVKRLNRDNHLTGRLALKIRKHRYSVLNIFSKNRLQSRRGLIKAQLSYRLVGLINRKKRTKSGLLILKYATISKMFNHATNWTKLSLLSQNIKSCSKVQNLANWRVQSLQGTKKRLNSLLKIKREFYTKSGGLLISQKLQSVQLKKNSHPYIRSRTNKNFIFKNFGMFITALMFFNQRNPFGYKYLFKKKIFSFLYPNEVRNALMARKKKIVFYQLVYKLKHKSKQKAHHSFTSFNKFFVNQYKTSLQNNANNFITRNLFNPSSKASRKIHSLSNYVISRDEILYNQNFAYRGVDLSFKRSEVKIPRVRFRPGYQRMWRNARNALKESMGLKFVYQQQLTRCLVRFYKNSNKYSFSRSEMSANRIIMYSRLLPDNPTVNIFINQKLIYLNGALLHTQQRILIPNDLVQLIVSVWYYIAYRWISNWTLKRHKKFKKLVYRKGLAGKHKIMKLKKQRSYYTPNWIYLARYDISDIKTFLEVDYFTLSAFVLYEPFTTNYYTPDESPDFRPNIYRMYNWKYIT